MRAASTGRRLLLAALAFLLLAGAAILAWGWTWLSLQSATSPNLLIGLTPLPILWLAWVAGRGAFRDSGVDVRADGIDLVDGSSRQLLTWQQIRCIWVETDLAREVLRIVPVDRSIIDPRMVRYPVVNRHGCGFDLGVVRAEQRAELFCALQAYAADAFGMPISAVSGGPTAADPRLRRRIVHPRDEFPGYPRSQRTGVVVLGVIALLAVLQGMLILTDVGGLDGVLRTVTLVIGIVVILVGVATAYYAWRTASVPWIRIAPDGVTTHVFWSTTHVPWGQIRQVVEPTLRSISVRPVDHQSFPRGRPPLGVPRYRRATGTMQLTSGAVQGGRREISDAFVVAAYAAGRPDAVAALLDSR